MIASLLDFVTRRRLAIAVVTALIAAVGLWSFANLQIDAIPDITGVQVQVNTVVPALAPEEIERLATLPIERAMAGQPGLEETRSLTKTGLSQVTLLYKDGTDQKCTVATNMSGASSPMPATGSRSPATA